MSLLFNRQGVDEVHFDKTRVEVDPKYWMKFCFLAFPTNMFDFKIPLLQVLFPLVFLAWKDLSSVKLFGSRGKN